MILHAALFIKRQERIVPMASILLAVIYLAFISMGLPDALLGSAWPSIYGRMNVPVSFAGIVTILIASGTVVSSLLSNRMLRRFGTGAVTVFCTGLTAVALLCFSVSNAFWQLCVMAIPYGLGAGSIDAALNNYVALHYKSRHMSWIHFCWGVGATAGPYVMGAILTGGQAWNAGYRVVGIIQAVMTICLLLSLPVWKNNRSASNSNTSPDKALTARQVLHLPGAKAVLAAFFCYCSLESSAGLWASSYMVLNRGIAAETAAKWASIFYLGITIGRFLCGFAADKIGDKNMIRFGQGLMVSGALVMLLPFGNGVCFMGLILTGLGCAPVYPCLLHETPQNFGKDVSQAIMGIQMACAYTGSTLMPPLFGLIAEKIGIAFYPVYLMIFAVAMLLLVEKLNTANKRIAGQTSISES
jgi:fucose permease